MEPATKSPGTVLIIDDDRGPRESLRMLLKKDYHVLTADSVDTGLELLKQHPPDVVILDIRMPGKNGIEGLKAIRELDPSVAVIMFTGFGALETAQEAIRLGANDYLKKPLDTHEILAVVRHNVQRTRVARRRQESERLLTELNHQLAAELHNKEHLATLGQKSVEFAHDLRSPLTAVQGFLELLARDLAESKEKLGERWKETSEYLDLIERSVTRCRELSEMWLNLGKAAANRRLVGVEALLREIAADLASRAAARAVRLEVQPGASPCAVSVDPLHIRRALENLVTNAIEAVAPGQGQVQLSYELAGTQVHICVADNGCGIKAEHLSKIFEPFFTTKQQTGTGLGLLIAKQAAEAHGGCLRIESEPGRGTRAYLSLPADVPLTVSR